MTKRGKKSPKDLDALGSFIAEGAAVMAGQDVAPPKSKTEGDEVAAAKRRRKARASKPVPSQRTLAADSASAPAS